MIEFDIIDFIGCFTLESLIDKMELAIGQPQLLAVKDRSESGAGDEATIALILVLEERLDQQSPVPDLGGELEESLVEFLFFRSTQEILWIQNRGRLEDGESSLGVLLQVLVREDVLDLFVEVEVSNFDGIVGASVVVFEALVLGCGQLQFLGVQSCSEFGGFDGALSERIVVLEELAKSYSVSLDVVPDLLHEFGDLSRAVEVGVALNVSGLGAGVGLVDDVSEALGVCNEPEILDIAQLVGVGSHA